MQLDEANKILNNAGYLMEDNQPQMSRKNLRKWLTSKYGIEFNRMTIGTYISRYVVNVPDDERQPITALKIERYVKPIDSAAIFDIDPMEDGKIDQKLFLAHAAIEATKKLGVTGIITDGETGQTARDLAAFRGPNPVMVSSSLGIILAS